MKNWMALVVLLAGGLSCGSPVPDLDRRDRGTADVGSIFVSVTHGERGSPTLPLPFSNTPLFFTVHLEVRSPTNAVLTDFNESLNLSVTPGVLLSINNHDRSHPEIVLGRNVRMTAGVAD